MTMTSDELRKMVAAATPGPWFEIDFSVPEVIGDHDPTASDISVSCSWPDPIFVANMGGGLDGFKGVGQALKDAAFIAASNPQAILALIARVRDLEAGLKPFADEGETWPELNTTRLGVFMMGSDNPILNDTKLTVGDFLNARRILKGTP